MVYLRGYVTYMLKLPFTDVSNSSGKDLVSTSKSKEREQQNL